MGESEDPHCVWDSGKGGYLGCLHPLCICLRWWYGLLHLVPINHSCQWGFHSFYGAPFWHDAQHQSHDARWSKWNSDWMAIQNHQQYPIVATSSNVNNDSTSNLGIGEFKDKTQWTHLPESYLLKSIFAKGYKLDDSCNPIGSTTKCLTIEYPATLAPDLVQKYRKSLRVLDADFRS